MKRSKPYRVRNFLFDALLMCITGGLWLIWIVIRELQSFSK
jgi:hypothetical protein